MPALKNHPPTATLPVPAPAPWAPSPSRGRPSWSGLLRLSLVSVPVKAYAAVSGTSASRFHLLHAGCGQRISYAKYCAQHGPVDITSADAGTRNVCSFPCASETVT
jgi:hypothetical protein